MKFPNAPYIYRAQGNANEFFFEGDGRWIASVLFNGELSVVQQEALARAICALPDLYAACDASDTAFAVLNVQDLGGQARACVREAWPLVQLALAKVHPNGTYAEAIKEAHEHEIKRLDGVVGRLRESVEYLLEHACLPNSVEVDFIRKFLADHFPS